MARAEWRDSAKERFWRSVVREWERSGLTARAFCARHGLAEHNLYAWRRTLAARDQERAKARDNAPTTGRASAQAATFVPVEVVGAAAAIEIALPGGAVLRVPSGADAATVRHVLAALTAYPQTREASC